MLGFLALGTLLGLAGGCAPGPLLALVVSETLQHGTKAGAKVALAPLLTDLPIVVVTLLLVARLSHFDLILGGISIFGSAVVAWFGYQCVRPRGATIDANPADRQALRKGILANALSPHPYLFWFTVGAPTVVQAHQHSTLAAVILVGSFYLMLVGSKLVLAIVTGTSRAFLTSRTYRHSMRVLGVLLGLFALRLLYDGLRLLGLTD